MDKVLFIKKSDGGETQTYYTMTDSSGKEAPVSSGEVAMKGSDPKKKNVKYTPRSLSEKIASENNKVIIRYAKEKESFKTEMIGSIYGYDIWLVDGDAVRNKFKGGKNIDQDYVNFTEGGNHGRYNFIPEKEIWIEDRLKDDDIAADIVHEIVECLLMQKGKKYDSAHNEIAKYEEDIRQEIKDINFKKDIVDIAQKYIDKFHPDKKKYAENTEFRFVDELRDYSQGQKYLTYSMYDNVNNLIGYIDYSIFEGEIYIDMINVFPEHRKKGFGKILMQNFMKDNPNKEIDWGYTTPEGLALKQSIERDKIAFRYAENIDLIQNDPEIIDRSKTETGIPRKYKNTKWYPSPNRKYEWEGQGGDREKHRGENTDTDYSWNYPSSGDEWDEKWNSEGSEAVQMLCPGEQGTVVPLGDYWAKSNDKVIIRYSQIISDVIDSPKLKTKSKQDVVVLKQSPECDFSESQENQETEDVNNEFRKVQLTVD